MARLPSWDLPATATQPARPLERLYVLGTVGNDWREPWSELPGRHRASEDALSCNGRLLVVVPDASNLLKFVGGLELPKGIDALCALPISVGTSAAASAESGMAPPQFRIVAAMGPRLVGFQVTVVAVAPTLRCVVQRKTWCHINQTATSLQVIKPTELYRLYFRLDHTGVCSAPHDRLKPLCAAHQWVAGVPRRQHPDDGCYRKARRSTSTGYRTRPRPYHTASTGVPSHRGVAAHRSL